MLRIVQVVCVSVLAVVLASGTAAAQQQTPDLAPILDPVLARVDIDVEGFVDGLGVFDRLASASPVLANIVKGTVRRARRKVSIGPTVGVFGSYADGADLALTFGVGIEVFKIPVLPSLDNLKVLLIERAKAKLKRAILDTLKGQPPGAEELERLASEVWEEALREILGMENIRARTMERPSLTIAVEGHRYFDSEVLGARLRLGKGVWKFTLAASLSLGYTEPESNIYVGPEVVVHFLTSKGPRASVLDVFVRADLEVRSRGEAHSHDLFVLGARYLVDLL